MVRSTLFVSSWLASSLSIAEGAHWAVLAATSDTWGNYRHQASVCHAYHALKDHGFPESNIIVMAVDDVAYDKKNPFPGKLFHKPDPEGDGKDVYEGCKIDYKGEDVTPDTFMGILEGSASGRVLESTSDDNVFVYIVDHGSSGMISFPQNVPFHKMDLQNSLKAMSSKGMFKKLTLYVEACYAGSMLEDLDVPGVYAVSATTATKSSIAWYCPHHSPWGTPYQGDDSKVAGVDLNTCMGDLWSISWLEDTDSSDIGSETLDAQYQASKSRVETDGNHFVEQGYCGLPQQAGDLTFVDNKVADFQGDSASQNPKNKHVSGAGIPVPQVDLALATRAYWMATPGAERLEAGASLAATLRGQLEAEAAYGRFLEILYPGDVEKQAAIATGNSPANQKECELASHRVFNTYGNFDATTSFSLQFHKYVVNACADVAASGANVDIAAAAKSACVSSTVV